MRVSALVDMCVSSPRRAKSTALPVERGEGDMRAVAREAASDPKPR